MCTLLCEHVLRSPGNGLLKAASSVLRRCFDWWVCTLLLGRYNSSVYLSERARFGDGVGPALSAVDPDINDRITWSMPAGNTSLFRVTELAPKVAGIFVGPANTNTSLMFTDVSLVVLHTLDVSIVDSGGLSDRATVTVNVVDSNDAPIVTPATFSVAENSAVGVVVGTVSAADPDNLRAGVRQTLSFRISSGDNDRRFAINSGTGIITVAKSTLDFESASNYDLTVEVSLVVHFRALGHTFIRICWHARAYCVMCR